MEAPTVEKHFELSVLVPFLDHILSDMKDRFSKHIEKTATMQGLLPLFLTDQSTVTSLQESIDFYRSDLPNADIVDEEFARWKAKWIQVPRDDRPASVEASLKASGIGSFPSITVLLKLFAVLPLSSVSCERSASVLRRLNTYLRCHQTEQRLSSLALVHVHYTKAIDVQRVCELFSKKHPRRLDVGSLLCGD